MDTLPLPAHTWSAAVIVHLSGALAALALGPVVLWTRQGAVVRPRLHRALGYAWITFMVSAAVAALFIRNHRDLNWAGFSPIHLLVPYTLGGLALAYRAIVRGEVLRHRKYMQSLYGGACLVAGAFTLLPGRLLGYTLWHDWLGWL